jgi:hypothetical protein
VRPEQLYEAFAFPSSCALGKRVFKKLFLENGDLTAADKRALTDAVGNVTWQFTLKPATIPVQPFRDDEREYDEIAVLEVELSDRRLASRVAELVHRAIPYPVLLVFTDNEGSSLSVAAKRLSRAERASIVVEDFEFTRWLDGAARSREESEFVASLRIGDMPHTHFRAMYEACVQRVVALACADLTERFDVAADRPYADRRADLAACRALQRQIQSLRGMVHAETSFARQVELNTQIKTLEQHLRRDIAAL